LLYQPHSSWVMFWGLSLWTFLPFLLHGCNSSDLFTSSLFQHHFFSALQILHVLIFGRLPPCVPMWLWLIQLGSGSCSRWEKFTQLTADQLFSGVLHGKEDHEAHMINNNWWGKKKIKGGHKRALRMNVMSKKRVSVSLSAHLVSLEIWFYHTELLMKQILWQKTTRLWRH